MQTIFPRRKTWVTGTCLMFLVLFVGALVPGRAVAGFTTCRTDPVATLSNGNVVTLYADTAADPTQITSVKYDLHIPTGTSVVSVSYDSYGALESLTVTADRNGRHYLATTTVTTTTASAVTVTAHMDISGQKTQDVNGWSGQPITVYI